MFVGDVSKIKDRYNIGQTVAVIACPVFSKLNRREFRRGVVEGVYEFHVTIRFKKYCESFSYVDIATGEVSIEVLMVA